MAKTGRRIALYELVNKARFKSAQEKALSTIAVSGRTSGQPQTTGEKPQAGAVWSTRPKTIRLYPDRIELCFSWQVTAIGLLALAAILLVFFRLGQITEIKNSKSKVQNQSAAIAVEKVMPQPKTVESAPATTAERPKMVEPMGDHIIVIASHQLSSHLEPVKQYFAGFGIATEIIKKGTRWLLVTQERFDSPQKAGNDGAEMKKKIISIGAGYKPPAGSGFEPFGAKPFQDAYGMKVN